MPSAWGSSAPPAPQPASWGTTSGLWGGLGRGSRASATGFTQRCQRQSQARWPRCHLPSRSSRRDRRGPAVLKDGPSPGRATPGTCTQQSREFGTEQGTEEAFQFCYWSGKCECPSKAQLGAFPASGQCRRECQCAATSQKRSFHLHPQVQGQSDIPGFSQQHRTVSTFVPCGQ